ncbi:MAG: EF-P lysine aminoacylase EpmA, partial [Gammaproteobacteria bacterium]|nr:EF-P lysine aminoacylase EpmA [Gammaproteobacteria bacterium]
MTWAPRAELSVLHERARVYRQIRGFLAQRGCLEVDTPLLSPATATDPQIESLLVDIDGRRHYLQTSPEFAMKRLLAAGSGSIFQIGHAFRGGEQGRLHHVEFAMLEWYRVGYDYRQLMDEMELLILTLSAKPCRFSRISYGDLFRSRLDIDPFSIGLDTLRGRCAQAVPGTDAGKYDFDTCLDLLLGAAIAPGLQGYCFVHDYPLSQAALARASAADPRVAERFELFYDGIELANGFSELTDAAEQRRRFEQDNSARRERGLPQYPVDERLLAAL